MRNKILTAVIFITFVNTAICQPVVTPLPVSTFISHYHLEIGYNFTTVLIFPDPVKAPDKGKSDQEFIMQKQSGVENVLILKAARRDFTSSNLHVFTASGKVYAFDVSYADSPHCTTFDLTRLDSQAVAANYTADSPIWFTGKPLAAQELADNVNRVKAFRTASFKKVKKDKIRLKLQSIRLKDDLIYFVFDLANASAITYPVDFIRLYIQDQKKDKRTSFQQNEITPYFKDTVTAIPAYSHCKYVIAVPSFTIPDNKKVLFEMYELNGGRNLKLEIKNRYLYHAKPL